MVSVMQIGQEMQMIGGQQRAMYSLLEWEQFHGIARNNLQLQGLQWRRSIWEQAMVQWKQHG